jgi:hypothetical protein
VAKGRSRRGREAKKPKGGKLPIKAASTFLRPSPVSAPPATKGSTK